jgi:hypothetical protein
MGSDIFFLDARALPSKPLAEAQKAIEKQVRDLGTTGPADGELLAAKKRAESTLVFDLSTNESRAARLAQWELALGDARKIIAEPSRYAAVTKDDVRRVAGDYLGPIRRNIVEARPPARPEEREHQALVAPVHQKASPGGEAVHGKSNKASPKKGSKDTKKKADAAKKKNGAPGSKSNKKTKP